MLTLLSDRCTADARIIVVQLLISRCWHYCSIVARLMLTSLPHCWTADANIVRFLHGWCSLRSLPLSKRLLWKTLELSYLSSPWSMYEDKYAESALKAVNYHSSITGRKLRRCHKKVWRQVPRQLGEVFFLGSYFRMVLVTFYYILPTSHSDNNYDNLVLDYELKCIGFGICISIFRTKGWKCG